MTRSFVALCVAWFVTTACASEAGKSSGKAKDKSEAASGSGSGSEGGSSGSSAGTGSAKGSGSGSSGSSAGAAVVPAITPPLPVDPGAKVTTVTGECIAEHSAWYEANAAASPHVAALATVKSWLDEAASAGALVGAKIAEARANADADAADVKTDANFYALYWEMAANCLERQAALTARPAGVLSADSPVWADWGGRFRFQGIQPLASAYYSYAVAASADAKTVWFTESGRQKLVRYSFLPTGAVRTEVLTGVPGVFGVAYCPDGALYVARDPSGTKVPELGVWRVVEAAGGATLEGPIMAGLLSPRQITCDESSNVYVTFEEGQQIVKWEKATGQTSVVVNNLGMPPQGVLARDGEVFWSEYGLTKELGRTLSPGRVRVKRKDGTIEDLATGIWRARGLAFLGSEIAVAFEANRNDQGNSGGLLAVDPANKTVRPLSLGIDYPGFIASAMNQVFITLVRDDLLVSFTEAPPYADKTPQPGDVALRARYPGTAGVSRVTLYNDAEVAFTFDLEAADANGTNTAWLEVPRASLDGSQVERAHGHDDPSVNVPGTFALPKVRCVASIGGVERPCASTILPLRMHGGSRWPMSYDTPWSNGSPRELPHASNGFTEKPLYYMIHLGI